MYLYGLGTPCSGCFYFYFFFLIVRSSEKYPMEYFCLDLSRTATISTVRESEGRVRNVVLIKCILDLGKPKRGWDFGWEGAGARWGTRGVSLQATWDWGGRFLSHLGGFQVIQLANAELPNAELPNNELLNAELLNAKNYQTPNITERRILQIG